MSLEGGLITAALSNLLLPKKTVSQQTNGLPFNVGNDFQSAQQQASVGITRQEFRLGVNGFAEVKAAGKWIKNAPDSIGVLYVSFGSFTGDSTVQDALILAPGAVYIGVFSGLTIFAPNCAAGRLLIGQEGVPPVDLAFVVSDKVPDIVNIPTGSVTRSAQRTSVLKLEDLSLPLFAPDATAINAYGLSNIRVNTLVFDNNPPVATLGVAPFLLVALIDNFTGVVIRTRNARLVTQCDTQVNAATAVSRYEWDAGDLLLVSPNIATNFCVLRLQLTGLSASSSASTLISFDERIFK